jgi:acetylglutamate kinase
MPFASNPYTALKSTARYVRQFRGKTFVIKLGGELLSDPLIRKAVCEQIALLWTFSIQIVLVHGGGSELDALCESLKIPIEKVAGRRVTTPQVLDAAKMVFAGKAHTDLLAELQACGVSAVGLSGVDANLIQAQKRSVTQVLPDGEQAPLAVDYGLVGEVNAVHSEILQHLLGGGYMPVIAPLSSDGAGTVFNTNADTIAAHLAVALGAEKLFFLLSVPGLLRKSSDASSLVTQATLEDLDVFEAQGVFSGGMRPKIAALRHAIQSGVPGAHLVSGVQADALLVEVFTNEGSGTMILPRVNAEEKLAVAAGAFA